MQAFCFFALFVVVGRGLYAEFYGCVTYHPTQEDKAHGKDEARVMSTG